MRRMNFFRRYSFILVLVITVFFAFNFFMQKGSANSTVYKTESTVATVAKPLGWSFQKILESIRSIYQNYIELVDIKEKYIQLKQENAKLQAELHITENIFSENQKLKTILNFKETNKFDFVVGKIIGFDPAFTFKSVKINLGKRDGIKPGMGAVSTAGVIGIVMRVQSKTCDLLLINDPNSNLDAIITRNQLRGILQGKLGAKMRFKYFDNNMTITVGDKIITSGLTGSFPANIPIGTVIKVQKNPDDLSQIIEVEPSVNLPKITEVLILKKTDPSIELMGEIAGADWIENVMSTGSGKKDESE